MISQKRLKSCMSLQKELWLNEVMGTAEKLNRAEAPPFLFTRIEQSVKAADTIPFKKAGIVFAGFAVLAIVNCTILLNMNTNNTNGSSNTYSTIQYNLYEQ